MCFSPSAGNTRASNRLLAREPSVRRLAVALLGATVIIAGVGACKKAPPAAAATPATAPAATQPAAKAAAPAVPAAVTKLLGRWMRSDGGYVLELRNPDLSGVLEASYFNPKPIKVSRAIWMQGAAGLQVMVELNDVGYPGATYVLSHDAQSDRLVGKYTQPAMQQTFDIEFERQAKP
jgi:hypothetical protein